MSNKPTQKTGIDWPTIAVMRPTRSKRESGLEAEMAPTEISHEIRGFLFSKNSGNMMYQKALYHFG
jgi:hypothetical protein